MLYVNYKCLFIKNIICACMSDWCPSKLRSASLDPLEVELPAIVNCHEGAQNQTQVLGKGNKSFNQCAVSPGSSCSFIL